MSQGEIIKTIKASKPRILHVAETLPGGIATYLQELVSLQCADMQVRVLAPKNQLHHLDALPVNVLHGYDRQGRNPRSLCRLALALCCHARDFEPDIIHLHSSFAGAIGRAIRGWLPKNVHLVYCPHGWSFVRDDSVLARSFYIAVEKILAHRADAWVAISQHELDVAMEFGISIKNAHVIRNGMRDTQHIITDDIAGCDPAFLNFIFVGRHDRQKGLDLLLEAFKKLSDYNARLYVIGVGVHDPAISSEDSENIRWLGWLSGADLLAYYRCCDAVIIPSRWEGFGLVALEAMRESRAVLASRCGGLIEVIEDGMTGCLFDVESSDSIANAIKRLSREQLKKYGYAGRERFMREFLSERMHASIQQMYLQILSK